MNRGKGPKKIAVIALSSPCEKSRFDKGITYLQSQGFQPEVMLEPYRFFGDKTYLFSSDSAERRSSALLQCMEDPSIDLLLAARGAYGAVDLLESTPFERLASTGKPVCGFSDSTMLLVPLALLSHLPVIHGPSLESAFSKAAEERDAKRSADALLALLKDPTCNPVAEVTLEKWNDSSREECEGKIIGGNLSALSALTGTRFLPSLDGCILFIEEVGEKPYRLHRMLSQLVLSGVLKKTTGVLIGDLLRCEHEKGLGPTAREAVCAALKPLDIPIWGGLPCGHGRLNLPLPLNRRAVIEKGRVRFG